MWMVCCWQLIASNIPAVNTRVKMERIASNIAGNIARCGCPLMSSFTFKDWLANKKIKSKPESPFLSMFLISGTLL